MSPCYSKGGTFMAKVTSKYQVTVPRVIADRYGIRPGDEIDWIAAGEVIRVVPPGKQTPAVDRQTQLRWFDQATARQSARKSTATQPKSGNRGWKREDLYERGRSR